MTAETRVLDITRLGAQGDGIADTPDGPLYVPYALPGERVHAEVKDGRVRLLEVLTNSDARAGRVCSHFGRCGGCVAQHMSARLYREWKRDAVRTAFAHRGLEPAIAELVTISPGTRRRAVFSARRTVAGVELGFNEPGTHTLVHVAECPVLLPAIVAVLPGLRALVQAALPAGGAARVAVTATPAGLDVALEADGQRLGAERRQDLARLASHFGLIRLSLGDEVLAFAAEPFLSFGGASVPLPPGAFIQASGEAESAMTDLVAAAIGKAKHVADLFCGIGTFSFPLARSAAVTAIDSDSTLLAALDEGARRARGLKKIATRVRDLLREPLSRKELEPFAAVVFDPPRAGAKLQAEQLARSPVSTIVAVSCNPATLARDARLLVDGGYAIERVTPIDQFVFSAQVEAIAVFRR